MDERAAHVEFHDLIYRDEVLNEFERPRIDRTRASFSFQEPDRFAGRWINKAWINDVLLVRFILSLNGDTLPWFPDHVFIGRPLSTVPHKRLEQRYDGAVAVVAIRNRSWILNKVIPCNSAQAHKRLSLASHINKQAYEISNIMVL